MAEEQWVTMTEAAEQLGVPLFQISRMAKRGDIKAVSDAVNRRVKLVELNEVRRVFERSIYYKNRK